MNDTVIGCFSPVVTVADRGVSGILVTGGTVEEEEEEEEICALATGSEVTLLSLSLLKCLALPCKSVHTHSMRGNEGVCINTNLHSKFKFACVDTCVSLMNFRGGARSGGED